MLSVVVEQPMRMAVCERPTPEPAEGEVRVRVRFAGICGSDLHIFHGKNPFATYPRIVGHEFVGHVDAVGAGVSALRLGERWWWIRWSAAASVMPAGSAGTMSAASCR